MVTGKFSFFFNLVAKNSFTVKKNFQVSSIDRKGNARRRAQPGRAKRMPVARVSRQKRVLPRDFMTASLNVLNGGVVRGPVCNEDLRYILTTLDKFYCIS